MYSYRYLFPLFLIFFVPLFLKAEENRDNRITPLSNNSISVTRSESFFDLLIKIDKAATFHDREKIAQYLKEAENISINSFQRAELYWRESRELLYQAIAITNNPTKRESLIEKAIKKANESLLLDSENINSIKWNWKLNMKLGNIENFKDGLSCSSWYSKARVLILQALSIDNSDAELWFSAAVLYAQTPDYLFGNKDYAISLIRKAVTINHKKQHRHMLLLADLLLLRDLDNNKRMSKFSRDKDLFVFTSSPIKQNFYYEGHCCDIPKLYISQLDNFKSLSDKEEAELILNYIVANIANIPDNHPSAEHKEYLIRIAYLLERIE